LRGYKAVGAAKRLQVFREFLENTDVLYVDQGVLDKTADIYSVLKPKGELPGEFDLIIKKSLLF